MQNEKDKKHIEEVFKIKLSEISKKIKDNWKNKNFVNLNTKK